MGELEPWVDENFIRSVFFGMGEQVNVKMIRDKFSGWVFATSSNERKRKKNRLLNWHFEIVMLVTVSSISALPVQLQRQSLWTVPWSQTPNVRSNWTGPPAVEFKTVGQLKLFIRNYKIFLKMRLTLLSIQIRLRTRTKYPSSFPTANSG